jgi:DNA ligase 1
MQELNVLQQLESTSSLKEKAQILIRNSSNVELASLLDAALNYKRKFWIKKINYELSSETSFNYTNAHQEFCQLLSRLETRTIVGNQAISEVEVFLNNCNELQQKWYSRVLKRDLKVGISATTVNKSGFAIPEFDVQLAKDGSSCKSLDSMVKKGLSVSPKLDGYRCLALVENGEVTLYTRNGEIFGNFPSIERSLSEICALDSCYVFDGEIMSDDFNKTQKSAFASKRGTVVGDVKYHVFDMIPYDEWVSELFVTPAFERYANLHNFLNSIDNKPLNIKAVERLTAYSLDEILKLEAKYVADGYEGAMTNPNVPYYKGKKSNKMLKFKSFLSMDCEVVSANLGTADGKYSEVLGSFTVLQENGVVCDVGSGYNEEERRELWDKRDDLVGRIMEVKYQNLSSEDMRMRFPVFMRWRDTGKGKGKI